MIKIWLVMVILGLTCNVAHAANPSSQSLSGNKIVTKVVTMLCRKGGVVWQGISPAAARKAFEGAFDKKGNIRSSWEAEFRSLVAKQNGDLKQVSKSKNKAQFKIVKGKIVNFILVNAKSGYPIVSLGGGNR